MAISLADIYKLVGKEDKVAVLTFVKGSDPYTKYGATLTVVFQYTQAEREAFDKIMQIEPLPTEGGIVKVKCLGYDVEPDEKKKLAEVGLKSDDILSIFPSPWPADNLFHSREKRSMRKIEIE